jgi:hypothetical protein
VPVPVGMRVFFAGFIPYVQQILKTEDGEPRFVDMNEGTSGGFKEVFLKLVVKMFIIEV